MEDDTAKLVKKIGTPPNADGYSETTETERTVYVGVISTKRSEFYAAMAAGIKIEKTFIMRKVDYEDEEKIKYRNKTYKIERSYEKNEMIEISCSEC